MRFHPIKMRLTKLVFQYTILMRLISNPKGKNQRQENGDQLTALVILVNVLQHTTSFTKAQKCKN